VSRRCDACGRTRCDRSTAAKCFAVGTGMTIGVVLLCEAVSLACLLMGNRKQRQMEARGD
jgi:hypothetical protein